jgi:hypothetical protein
MIETRRFAPALGALILVACFFARSAHAESLQAALAKLAPNANPQVIDLALKASDCAAGQGGGLADRLAVIDYSLPSTQPRLWVFDLVKRKLLFQELVAHGKNSGDNLATRFSNANDSHSSSLGLFRTTDTYAGKNGYSLRMDGLERGVNDNAQERAIVIHGASYVSAAEAREQGRIGRSWGCPAVRLAVAHPLIDALKGGQMLFSYYPDKRWLSSSPYLKCSNQQTAQVEASRQRHGDS